MKVIDNDNRPIGTTVVTVGNFDGVHLGHQRLVNRGLEVAKEQAAELVVVTFDPHPSRVLKARNAPFLLTPLPLKLRRLAELGVQWTKVIEFTPQLAQVPALAFLELEIRPLHPAAIIVGYNFTFGAGGVGNTETLREWGRARDVVVEVVSPVGISNGPTVSSSLVRARLKSGEVNAAAQVLGSPFTVEGRVKSGDGRGGKLGFHTANVIPDEQQIMPPYGVYVGFLEWEDGKYRAVANWGVRPTFDGETPVLEIHGLTEEPLSLVNQLVSFQFLERIRGEKKFSSVDELKTQIAQDIAVAEKYLANMD